MKKMKLLLKIPILFILIFNTSFADDIPCEKDELNIANGYRLYECRVENICKNEYFDKIKNAIVYDTNTDKNKYDEKIEGSGLDNAKETYRDNINNIYKCGILKVQKDSLTLIKDKLLAIDKGGAIKNKIDTKISLQITKLELSFDNIGCIDTKSTTIQNKYNILNQATYELCKHTSYLELLKEYNSDINNVLFPKPKAGDPEITQAEIDGAKYSVKDVSNIITSIQTNIDNEIDHSYEVFPLAFHAYSEYENNYSIHVLLQLLREDYMVLRQKIYAALNPINQVVYKIANAMSMD